MEQKTSSVGKLAVRSFHICVQVTDGVQSRGHYDETGIYDRCRVDVLVMDTFDNKSVLISRLRDRELCYVSISFQKRM